MSNNSSDKLIDKIIELAAPLCESEDTEFVHAEFSTQGKLRVLRVYIDKEGGVTIDDCARISRELSDLLDVKIDIPGKYSLEVSSPGINRPLVKPDDFKRFKGEKAQIKIDSPLREESNRRNFKGLIIESDEDFVVLELEDGTEKIPFEKIKSARLNPDI
jgi:ribosome maturation factor RimP